MICNSVSWYWSRFSISNEFYVMLECHSCKRGSDIERTLIELEERNSLITNNEDEKDSSNESKYAIETI